MPHFFAADLGPGGFTGVRVGVTAKAPRSRAAPKRSARPASTSSIQGRPWPSRARGRVPGAGPGRGASEGDGASSGRYCGLWLSGSGGVPARGGVRMPRDSIDAHAAGAPAAGVRERAQHLGAQETLRAESERRWLTASTSGATSPQTVRHSAGGARSRLSRWRATPTSWRTSPPWRRNRAWRRACWGSNVLPSDDGVPGLVL